MDLKDEAAKQMMKSYGLNVRDRVKRVDGNQTGTVLGGEVSAMGHLIAVQWDQGGKTFTLAYLLEKTDE